MRAKVVGRITEPDEEAYVQAVIDTLPQIIVENIYRRQGLALLKRLDSAKEQLGLNRSYMIERIDEAVQSEDELTPTEELRHYQSFLGGSEDFAKDFQKYVNVLRGVHHVLYAHLWGNLARFESGDVSLPEARAALKNAFMSIDGMGEFEAGQMVRGFESGLDRAAEKFIYQQRNH